MPPSKEITILSFLLAVLVLIGSARASVVHEVRVKGDSAEITSILEMTSQKEVNKWRLTVDLPRNSTVETIRDSRGNISFEWVGSEVKFETNSGPSRKREKVEINYNVPNVREEQFKPLDTIHMSLFGFSNETLKAEIFVDHAISWYTPLNFKSQKGEESLKFQGQGSLPLYIYTSEKGEQSQHYHYFSEEGIDQVEKLFPLLPYFTGIRSPHRKFPIVFLNDSRYNSLINEWSSGRYRRGGLVLIRDNLSQRDKIPTVLHETMHGFNAELLKWDRTQTAYFDEGMAKFVEFLTKEKMDLPQGEIFGDRNYFEEGENRYYLEPRSSSEALWNYYSDGEEWMLRWNPWGGEGPSAKEFGYAYSELLIREHVQQNGIKSLRNVSAELLGVEDRVENWRKKSDILSQILDGLKPCYSRSRKEFNDCLERVNAQQFNLTDLNLNVTFERPEKEEINITRREVEISKPPSKEIGPEKNFLTKLRQYLESLFERIRWILKRL